MQRIQVIYASRHGATEGIAERIADTLRTEGVEVELRDAATQPDPSGFDAYVVGSGIYLGSWLDHGIHFLEHNIDVLSAKPVWLFSSGPLPGSSKATDTTDPLALALGPEDGPGSGGRKRIAALSAAIQPRDHRVFQGAYDSSDPPKSIPERVLRLLPVSKDILPVGDFREWDAIEAWAHKIADELAAVPVA